MIFNLLLLHISSDGEDKGNLLREDGAAADDNQQQQEQQQQYQQHHLLLTAFVGAALGVIVVWSGRSGIGIGIGSLVRSLVRAASSFYSRLYLRLVVLRGGHDSKTIKGTVSQLFVHPVKSLRPVSKDRAVIDARGFAGDRRFMIVYPAPLPSHKQATGFGPDDATHRFLTQRQCPTLATVVTDVNERQKTITLTSHALPGERVTFSTVPPPDAPTYRSTLWDDVVVVRDAGDSASKFLRKLLQQDPAVIDELKGADVRLVVQADDDRRVTDDDFTPAAARTGSVLDNRPAPVALTDGFPILIASEASLAELNRRLKEKKRPELPMSRFRPNIVITSSTAASSSADDDEKPNSLRPFEEDRWKTIRIGSAVFHVVKPCPRCKQSCTDQLSGAVDVEPLKTLAEFRALDPTNSGNLYFAQNAIPCPDSVGKTISVGDTVEVLQWGDPIYAD